MARDPAGLIAGSASFRSHCPKKNITASRSRTSAAMLASAQRRRFRRYQSSDEGRLHPVTSHPPVPAHHRTMSHAEPRERAPGYAILAREGQVRKKKSRTRRITTSARMFRNSHRRRSPRYRSGRFSGFRQNAIIPAFPPPALRPASGFYMRNGRPRRFVLPSKERNRRGAMGDVAAPVFVTGASGFIVRWGHDGKKPTSSSGLSR
jgi:hypothetical protein